MPKAKIICQPCENKGKKSRVRCSNITGCYWCHNCNNKINLKKEIKKVCNERISYKIISKSPRFYTEFDEKVSDLDIFRNLCRKNNLK